MTDCGDRSIEQGAGRRAAQLLRVPGYGWLLGFSTLFAFAATVGWLYHGALGNITILGLLRQHAIGAMVLFAGTFAATYVVLCLAFPFIDGLTCRTAASDNDGTAAGNIFSWRNWAKYAGAMALCWLPYVVIFHPAISRGFDYFWQLMQGLGIMPLSSHHPVFSSCVFGWLFSVGYSLGGVRAGFFLTTFVQYIVAVTALGFCFACLQGMGAPRKLLAVLCATLCLCPVFPTHALWLIKDSLFSSFCVLLFFQVFLHAWCSARHLKQPWFSSAFAIVVVALLFSLFRQGVAVIAFVLFGVLFVVDYSSKRIVKGDGDKKTIAPILKKWGIAVAVFAVMLWGWGVHLSDVHAYPTNAREVLTFPARQVLRTVQLNPEELSANDRIVLEQVYRDRIAAGESLEDIVSLLDEYNGDRIKVSYIEDYQTLADFFGLWVGLGVAHPGCYLDAALRGTDGYWWFNPSPEVQRVAVELGSVESDFANEDRATRPFDTYQEYVVRSMEYAGMDTRQNLHSLYKSYPMLEDILRAQSTFPVLREQVKHVVERVAQLPVLKMLFMPALYFWLTLAALCYLVSRKRLGRLCWPLLLIWLLAFLSPVDGYTRYVIAAETFSLVLVGMCFLPSAEKCCCSWEPMATRLLDRPAL